MSPSIKSCINQFKTFQIPSYDNQIEYISTVFLFDLVPMIPLPLVYYFSMKALVYKDSHIICTRTTDLRKKKTGPGKWNLACFVGVEVL